jgi:hypothetical protein
MEGSTIDFKIHTFTVMYDRVAGYGLSLWTTPGDKKHEPSETIYCAAFVYFTLMSYISNDQHLYIWLHIYI